MQKINTYKILRPIVVGLMKIFYNPKIEGKENIPQDGKIILAGNHLHLFDPLLLAMTTKRQIFFLSKKQLFKGPMKVFFNSLGCIPVDRDGNDLSSITKSVELLEEDECLGIFPEGTRNKTDNIILPFKLGTVMIAKRGKSNIIPFAITGKYKLFKNNLHLKVGKCIETSDYKAKDLLEKVESDVKSLILKK